jgi:hypothetical protein
MMFNIYEVANGYIIEVGSCDNNGEWQASNQFVCRNPDAIGEIIKGIIEEGK